MSTIHSFHIPVMGLGLTVNSPLKVAKFGISSVVSKMDDHLLVEMRRIYFRKFCLPYIHSEDYRARRVKAYLEKKVILKVSDFGSAMIQGRFLAKKGIWVSEFRIESGLNCGGHAFATNGLLIGPI